MSPSLHEVLKVLHLVISANPESQEQVCDFLNGASAQCVYFVERRCIFGSSKGLVLLLVFSCPFEVNFFPSSGYAGAEKNLTKGTTLH